MTTQNLYVNNLRETSEVFVSNEKPKENDDDKKKEIPMEGSYKLILSLELRRDAINVNIAPGIVSLTFTEFGVTYDKVMFGWLLKVL